MGRRTVRCSRYGYREATEKTFAQWLRTQGRANRVEMQTETRDECVVPSNCVRQASRQVESAKHRPRAITVTFRPSCCMYSITSKCQVLRGSTSTVCLSEFVVGRSRTLFYLQLRVVIKLSSVSSPHPSLLVQTTPIPTTNGPFP